MGRLRVFFIISLAISASISLGTDWRLVIASDDPATRKAAAIVIFEKTGKLTPEDRITSITFSAGADVKTNCLVSLDPATGKTSLALSPDVEVFRGKVLIAGAKPTKKVIPAYLTMDIPVVTDTKDGKLSGVMQPIIQQVNSLPWFYIVAGIIAFMAFMYVMNRRSQQYTTSMSKEAKNLYMETVGRITERLERIEVNQDRLVKNPPVVRTFKTQIEDFEARLGRIEKIAKEGRDEMGRAAAELSQSDKRHDDLVGKIESTKAESIKSQVSLKEEADALRSEIKLLVKSQDESGQKLEVLSELKVSAIQIADQNRSLEAKLAAQEELMRQNQEEHRQLVMALQAELATVRANQESLLSMPKELELVSASMAKFPAEFEAVRSSFPRLDGIELRLDSMGPRFDEVNDKLGALPSIENSIQELPSRLPRYDEDIARIQDSILREIEGLSTKLDESGSSLGELISAHSFSPSTERVEALPEAMSEEPEAEVVVSKRSKKGKAQKHEEQKAEPVADFVTEAQDVSDFAEETAWVEPIDAEENVVFEDASTDVESELEVLTEATLPEEAELEPVEENVIDAPELVQEPVMVLEELPEVSSENSEENLPDEVEVEAPESVDAIVPEVWEEEPVQDVTRETHVDLEALETPELAQEMVAENEANPEAQELEYRYIEPSEPEIPEFHFNNAIQKMAKEDLVIKETEESVGKEAPVTFHLETLPDHLETFEDDDALSTLPTFRVETNDTPLDDVGETEAVELVLKQLGDSKSATKDLESFDGEAEDYVEAHMGHWTGFAGSSARTYGSESSRPLDLVKFEGDLKPLTPIETAPIGDTIGGMVYGFGRVIYNCGSTIHGFWPGRDNRTVSLDNRVPLEEWRLALKGQGLFVAEEKRVKILSIQGWFVLEQFAGTYLDQMVTDRRWIGLRADNGPVIDFRDQRGQMIGETKIDLDPVGLKLCAHDEHVYIGAKDGRILEATEFGTEVIHHCSDKSELLHLSCDQDGPIALYRTDGNIECWTSHGTLSMELESYSGNPVLLGNRLYLADTDRHELVCGNLKKMQRSSVKSFADVQTIRRIIGVQHKNQNELFAITTDEGKKGGRLIMIDAKTGHEKTFGAVGQADVNMIVADHHLVLATSSQYQNVIRVLEPFAEKVAA